MPSYEVEIKSLLGGKAKADELLKKMQSDPSFRSLGLHNQLNHYFINGDLNCVCEKLKLDLSSDLKNFSVRSRQADNKVILVIKAAVDDTTSSNGTARREFETEVNLTLDQLDQILLGCGFKYQAKWSRERQDFKYKDMNVTIDKNAGYGYLAEFEKVIEDQNQVEKIKTVIRDSMQVLGLAELAQDRLERMFDYYNKNWQDYYGTEKTFTIK